MFAFRISLFIVFLRRYSTRDSFHTEHRQSLIDLIHAQSFFSLLEFAHKTQSESGAKSKFFLRQFGFPSFFFDKYSDFVFFFHIKIINPYGYKIK